MLSCLGTDDCLGRRVCTNGEWSECACRGGEAGATGASGQGGQNATGGAGGSNGGARSDGGESSIAGTGGGELSSGGTGGIEPASGGTGTGGGGSGGGEPASGGAGGDQPATGGSGGVPPATGATGGQLASGGSAGNPATAGAAGTTAACEPGTGQCVGNAQVACNGDGTGYDPAQECSAQWCYLGSCADGDAEAIGTTALTIEDIAVGKTHQCLMDTDRVLVQIEAMLQLFEPTEITYVVYERIGDTYELVTRKTKTHPAGTGFIASGRLDEPVLLQAGHWYSIGLGWRENVNMFYEGANGDENMPITFNYGTCVSAKTLYEYPLPDSHDGDGSAAVYRHRWTTVAP